MVSRRNIRRLCALGLLPLLLLTGTVPGFELFRCRHDGTVGLSSCCADVAEAEDFSPAEITEDELACCEVTRVEFQRAQATPAGAHVDVALPPLAQDWRLDLGALARRVDVVSVTRLPDATGPPIRLKTQTFLN